MPRAKPVASLSGMVETDMEDDTLNMEADAFPTPDSNQENGPPAKKKGRQGKATAKKFSKPKTRLSSDGIARGKAAPATKAGRKRAPLKEQKNAQHAEDTEEVDEFEAQANEDTVMDELVEAKQPPKRKAPEKKAGRPPKKAAKKDGEFEYTPTTTRQTKGIQKTSVPPPQKTRANKYQQATEPPHEEKVIPETQIPMHTEPSGIFEDVDDEDAVPQSVFRRAQSARTAGRPHQPSVARKRTGSASDTEKVGNDPAMRRKLGDMTRKFENMEMKYKTLKETVAKEAVENSQNFEAKLQARDKGNEIKCLIASTIAECK